MKSLQLEELAVFESSNIRKIVFGDGVRDYPIHNSLTKLILSNTSIEELVGLNELHLKVLGIDNCQIA